MLARMLYRSWNLCRESYLRRRMVQSLRWQSDLVSKGIGIRTEILEIENERSFLNDYMPCRVKARIRVKGKMVCRWFHTVLSVGRVIRQGDMVHIRYRPGQLHQVLIQQN